MPRVLGFWGDWRWGCWGPGGYWGAQVSGVLGTRGLRCWEAGGWDIGVLKNWEVGECELVLG